VRKTIPMVTATLAAAFLALTLLITCMGIRAQPARAAATTYTLTPLDPLGGATGGATIARGVNASGQVVGQSQKLLESGPPLQLRGFIYQRDENGQAAMEDLGTLGGLTSAARGINDKGQVVGFSRTSAGNQQQAFVAEEDADGKMGMVGLGNLAGFPSSEAWAINEPGQIVGRSSILPRSGTITSGRAFLYRKGESGVATMENLGVLSPGDTYSEAYAINDSGKVVGASGSDEEHGQAFLYSNGSIEPLGRLEGYPYSAAMGIDNDGRIVGWSYSSRVNVQGRAFLYRDGKMEDLGTLPGDSYSMARAIDEHGRVVGQSRDAGGQNRAFLWENGVMKDLNSMIPADSPLKLLDAYSISESGEIVGSAFNKDLQVRAFLLTPNDSIAPNTTASISSEPNAAGWNNEDVTVTLDATDEGGSNVEGITYSASGAHPIADRTVHGSSTRLSVAAEGETTITYSARDHVGNTEEPKTITVRIDKTGPEVSIASPAEGAEYVLGETVAAEYACSDAVSGLVSCLGTVPDGASIDTASVGQKTFAVEATDEAGNVGSESLVYLVIYDFDGFFSPVDNPDVLNRARAGSAIPVKFSLGGDQGLDIFAEADGSSFPKSGPIPCDSTDPVDAVEQTVTANSSGLTYDATTDLYTYVWKTRKDWTGCRQLVVRFDDGKEYAANFTFIK
jgi:probable HAF family extracellular repeat protein